MTARAAYRGAPCGALRAGGRGARDPRFLACGRHGRPLLQCPFGGGDRRLGRPAQDRRSPRRRPDRGRLRGPHPARQPELPDGAGPARLSLHRGCAGRGRSRHRLGADARRAWRHRGLRGQGRARRGGVQRRLRRGGRGGAAGAGEPRRAGAPARHAPDGAELHGHDQRAPAAHRLLHLHRLGQLAEAGRGQHRQPVRRLRLLLPRPRARPGDRDQPLGHHGQPGGCGFHRHPDLCARGSRDARRARLYRGLRPAAGAGGRAGTRPRAGQAGGDDEGRRLGCRRRGGGLAHRLAGRRGRGL